MNEFETQLRELLNSMGFWQYIVVFVLVGITSTFWVFYIRRTNEGKGWQAGLMDMILYVVGGAVIISFNRNFWLLLVAGISTFIFTTLTTYYDERKKNNKQAKKLSHEWICDECKYLVDTQGEAYCKECGDAVKFKKFKLCNLCASKKEICARCLANMIYPMA